MGKTVRKGFGVSLWRREFLPHIIVERPLGISDMSKNNDITRADDQFFIMNNSITFRNFHLYIGLIGYLLSYFFSLANNADDSFSIFIRICLFLFSTFYIIYNFTHPQKILILDRLNGIITFPGFLYGKAITMPFEEVLAEVRGGYGAGMATLALLHQNKLTAYSAILESTPLQSWSFMVWYMDKNRPLPPGKVFDPYRKRDYERRKAEGFPEPLYESWISIFEYYEYYDEQFQARKEHEERQKRRNKRNNKYK